LPRYGVENADTFSCSIKTAQNMSFKFYDYQNITIQTKVMDIKHLMGINLQGFFHEVPLDKYILTYPPESGLTIFKI
jgi:hypothetical protein